MINQMVSEEINKLINEQDVIRLVQKYNFKRYELHANNNLYIKSQHDEWVAEDHITYIKLRHFNRRRKKVDAHTQRLYQDLDYMFNSIAEHDWYVKEKKIKPKVKPSRMEMLFQKIAAN